MLKSPFHTPARFLFLFVSTICITGCGQDLYVAHDTVVGLNAEINPSSQSTNVTLGYDREFVTVIPTVPTNDGSEEREAMALLGCTHLEVDGIFLRNYSDEIVSGKAAIAMAEKLGAGADTGAYFKCHQRGSGS